MLTKVYKKGRDLTQPYDKSPYTSRKFKKKLGENTKRHQNFDNTMIANRLRTVSLSIECHQTGVDNPVYGISTFPLTAKAV